MKKLAPPLHTEMLRVMQDGLRLPPKATWDMYGFLCDHGAWRYFDQESLAAHDSQRTSLIAIARTEDGKMWIRDGLHRTLVIHIFRGFLDPSEYVLEDIPYEKFTEVNLEAGWFTPFDPRREVRLADFHVFKEGVKNMLKHGVNPLEVAGYIRRSRDHYCVPRCPKHTLDRYCQDIRAAWRDLQAAEEDYLTK